MFGNLGVWELQCFTSGLSSFDESNAIRTICEIHGTYHVSPRMLKFNVLVDVYFIKICMSTISIRKLTTYVRDGGGEQ